jgi:hypothetical protein
VHMWGRKQIRTLGRGRAAWSCLSGRRRCFARRRRRARYRCEETGAWSDNSAERERERVRGKQITRYKRLISLLRLGPHALLTHRTVMQVQMRRSKALLILVLLGCDAVPERLHFGLGMQHNETHRRPKTRRAVSRLRPAPSAAPASGPILHSLPERSV